VYTPCPEAGGDLLQEDSLPPCDLTEEETKRLHDEEEVWSKHDDRFMDEEEVVRKRLS